jgi:hypothetical protein
VNFFKKSPKKYKVAVHLILKDNTRELSWEVSIEERPHYIEKADNVVKDVLSAMETATSTDKKVVYIPHFGIVLTGEFKAVFLNWAFSE